VKGQDTNSRCQFKQQQKYKKTNKNKVKKSQLLGKEEKKKAECHCGKKHQPRYRCESGFFPSSFIEIKFALSHCIVFKMYGIMIDLCMS